MAAERLPELLAVHPGSAIDPAIEPPASRASRAWGRAEAIVELMRGRIAVVGPTTACALADALSIAEGDVDAALSVLESEGVVLRGAFETMNAKPAKTAKQESFARFASSAFQPSSADLQWCDRRLLARIHRYTLNRLRAEIEPVSPADFMRFLFSWQHVDRASRLTGIDGLRAVVEALDGFELAADAWERAVLSARIESYEPAMLDTLCLTGEVGWARLSTSARDRTQLVGTTPVALFLREHADAWQALRASSDADPADAEAGLENASRRVIDALRLRGASFIPDLATACGLDEARVRTALVDLVAAGLVASDGFGGLRSIVRAASGRQTTPGRRANVTGRWSALGPVTGHGGVSGTDTARSIMDVTRDAAVEAQARTLLRRYGLVFRRLLAREANVAPWRELTRVYRRLEARGEVRGGRFVSGMSGEQFALADAVERLREIRRTPPDGRCVVISAADPLNLAGIVTTGDRVRAVAGSRVAYRDGVPLAALEGDYVRPLILSSDLAPAIAVEVASSLAGRPMPAVLSGFVGRT